MPWSTEPILTLSTHQLWWVIDDSDDDVHDGDDHDSGDDDKDDGIDYDSSDDVIDGDDVVDLFLTVYSSDGPRPPQPSLHCHPGQITPPTSWARSKSPPKKISQITEQGPMAHTVADFWQMVWEQGSVVLVMLSRYQTWTSQDYHDDHNDHEYHHTLDHRD